VDGARRLGRNAMILSIVAILGGLAIIAAGIALNWGREYRQGEVSKPRSLWQLTVRRSRPLVVRRESAASTYEA